MPSPTALPKASVESYEKTLARLDRIKNHLSNSRSARLAGKVCIITGVASKKGIGRASAMLFAHEGASHLYLLDYSPENLPELKETIQKTYPDVKVTTFQGDAADEALISRIVKQAMDEEGRLDVFFANAGMATRKPLQSSTSEEFMNSIRVNTLSCFLAIKHGSEAIRQSNPAKGKDDSGGSIIMTASVAGIRSGAGTMDYSASKAAVNSLAKTAAFQLARSNVRVNSICPGLIETAMNGETFEAARGRGTAGKIGQLNPMGRYGIAEEIARVALFLATDEASYINGQNIAVDGGLSASHPVMPGKWA